MKLSAVAFEAKSGNSAKEQATDCLNQLEDFISDASMTLKNIVSINFFLSAGNAETYHTTTHEVVNALPDEITSSIPVAYLAQAPATGSKVSSEIYYINDLKNAEVISKEESGYIYRVVQNTTGEKLVVASGIGENNHNKSITEKAENVFGIIERILKREALDFSHIFRQWNYIEDIIHVEQDDRNSQHYQQFNNVRSSFYSKADFKHGYPAATGIGINTGGVMVSFFAASTKGFNTLSVENPLQKAAFEYSDDVLVGDAQYRGASKCTPKFARAKWVANHESEQVFISGTAAIREETTIGPDDITRQTEVTIENMQQLISGQTLSALDINSHSLPRIEFIRVYIKFPEDYLAVKKICENLLPGIPGIYVVSDICRDDLLVEIEGNAVV